MNAEKTTDDGSDIPKVGHPDSSPKPADPKELSRFERLKLKIKKLQGKDPDIYPMF